MQDEVNTKVVAIAIKGGRITAEVLKKALAKFIEEIEKAEKQASQPKTYRGKQSIKHLVEQNAAISNIEVTDETSSLSSVQRTSTGSTTRSRKTPLSSRRAISSSSKAGMWM